MLPTHEGGDKILKTDASIRMIKARQINLTASYLT